MGPNKVMLRRLCESNSAECTGINPCEYCYAFIFAKIIPNTVRVAGGPTSTRESAMAAFKTFDETWKKALDERIAEKEAVPGTPPFTTQPLLEFLAFKESRRKHLALKEKQDKEFESSTRNPASGGASHTKQESKESKLDEIKSDNNENGKKGTPLARGDLKRLADKQAKESLAPGKSHSVNAGNGTDSGVDLAEPREEKH